MPNSPTQYTNEDHDGFARTLIYGLVGLVTIGVYQSSEAHKKRNEEKAAAVSHVQDEVHEEIVSLEADVTSEKRQDNEEVEQPEKTE